LEAIPPKNDCQILKGFQFLVTGLSADEEKENDGTPNTTGREETVLNPHSPCRVSCREGLSDNYTRRGNGAESELLQRFTFFSMQETKQLCRDPSHLAPFIQVSNVIASLLGWSDLIFSQALHTL